MHILLLSTALTLGLAASAPLQGSGTSVFGVKTTGTSVLGTSVTSTGGASSAATSLPGSTLNGEWTLVSATQRGQALALNADKPLTLSIKGSQLGGYAGCNSFGASLGVQGSQISIGRVIHTMRACMDPEANRTEGAYLRLLGSVRHAAISGDQLTLSAPDSSTLVYRRAP